MENSDRIQIKQVELEVKTQRKLELEHYKDEADECFLFIKELERPGDPVTEQAHYSNDYYKNIEL